MGYHVVRVADLEATPDRPCVQKSISDAADLDNLAVNVYEAAPGEQIPLAYHVHAEQEEVFYVLSGTLHVETPDGEKVVEQGSAFVAEPESPHRAYNPEDAVAPVRVLAMGAPPADDVRAYGPDDD